MATAGYDPNDPAYFAYYGHFIHQQNMLQDSVRTTLYQTAINANGPNMFAGKTVLDLGAGTGVLSYLAVQAGAQHVYAVEASGMADKIKKIVDFSQTNNPMLTGKITVLKNKIEEIGDQIPRVDTLISEPIGVMLVHERMLESYLIARDRFLKPNGNMFPSKAVFYVAPFTDADLWTHMMSKVRFWEQKNFYGVDLSPLSMDAREEIFSQVIVGSFESRILLAPPCTHILDFRTITADQLHDIVIPFSCMAMYTGLMHGIAVWFDVDLGGRVLSTSPASERTHWHQSRVLFREPLAVNAFETIRGWIRLKVNAMRSYDISGEVVLGVQAPLSNPHMASFAGTTRAIPDGFTRRTGKWALQEQMYYFEPASASPYGAEPLPEHVGLYNPELFMG